MLCFVVSLLRSSPILSCSSRICAIIVLVVALQIVQISEASGRIYDYYRSRLGKVVVSDESLW